MPVTVSMAMRYKLQTLFVHPVKIAVRIIIADVMQRNINRNSAVYTRNARPWQNLLTNQFTLSYPDRTEYLDEEGT
jgi:hypothetical protein